MPISSNRSAEACGVMVSVSGHARANSMEVQQGMKEAEEGCWRGVSRPDDLMPLVAAELVIL